MTLDETLAMMQMMIPWGYRVSAHVEDTGRRWVEVILHRGMDATQWHTVEQCLQFVDTQACQTRLSITQLAGDER